MADTTVDSVVSVETGAKKIGSGNVGEGVEETAKGIGKTVEEGAKYTGEKLKEAGKAAEPEAKSTGRNIRDGAVAFMRPYRERRCGGAPRSCGAWVPG